MTSLVSVYTWQHDGEKSLYNITLKKFPCNYIVDPYGWMFFWSLVKCAIVLVAWGTIERRVCFIYIAGNEWCLITVHNFLVKKMEVNSFINTCFVLLPNILSLKFETPQCTLCWGQAVEFTNRISKDEPHGACFAGGGGKGVATDRSSRHDALSPETSPPVKSVNRCHF